MRISSTAVLLLGATLAAAEARADTPGAAPEPPARTAVIDRVVVRWHAPETGGPSRPQFIFERELAFEARLESLADPDPELGAYHDRHVRSALDRHIGETLLASLATVPPPDEKTIATRAELHPAGLGQRVQGRAQVLQAAAA